MHSATDSTAVLTLERLVINGVAVTATAIAETAPDLTFLQWRVIVVLADAPGGVPVGELARQLGSKLPATSRLLGRLRRRDLVVSHKGEADRRVTNVELTVAGRRLWKRIVDRRRVDLEAVLRASGLDATGARALERVASAFSTGVTPIRL